MRPTVPDPPGAMQETPRPGRARIPATHIDERVHDDLHVLLWQAHGTTRCVVDGHELRLHREQALWLPAGCVHAFTVEEDSVLLPAFFETARPTTMTVPTRIRPSASARLLILALVQSQASIVKPDLPLEAMLLSALERMPPVEVDMPMPRSVAALQVAEALLERPGDPRTVAAWAEAAHTSVRALERAFSFETGMAFRAWRQACRLHAAVAMLDGSEPVAHVARRVGYRDHSAFSRRFKDRFGVTPSEHARRQASAARLA